MAASRIRETIVPPFVPEGRIRAVICGEAPGPRGADKSERPFWGDRAGLLLYRALHRAGALRSVRVAPPGGETGALPGLLADEIAPLGESFEDCSVLFPWSGSRFAAEGISPLLVDVMLTNAYNICPTSDGTAFRRPTKAQMLGKANLDRLAAEVQMAASRSEGHGVVVLALGMVAAEVLGQHLGWAERGDGRDGVTFIAHPHPSPQGILSWRRKLGGGIPVSSVQERWIDGVSNDLRACGVGA